MESLMPKLINIITYLFELLDHDPVKYYLIVFGVPVGVMLIFAIIWTVGKIKKNRPLGIVYPNAMDNNNMVIHNDNH